MKKDNESSLTKCLNDCLIFKPYNSLKASQVFLLDKTIKNKGEDLYKNEKIKFNLICKIALASFFIFYDLIVIVDFCFLSNKRKDITLKTEKRKLSLSSIEFSIKENSDGEQFILNSIYEIYPYKIII